ncbi:MAG: inositol monophosphatase family protein [Candidatus Sericytochromatia bacterium]
MINIAKEACLISGKILLDNLGKLSSCDIETKGINNFVTYVDKQSEESIIKIIKTSFPEHCIFAEESGDNKKDSDYRWLIDPLDGTTNYIHGVPFFAVSIALEYKGEIILGVIYDPVRGEMFYAEKGKGAFLNSKEICVSNKENIANSIITVGFPYKSYHNIEHYINTLTKIAGRCSNIRKIGSAALDLAYVASGRFDGYWELDLGQWDIAAGIIIIREAGGIVTDTEGNNGFMETGNTLASNRKIHKQLLEVLNKV